MFLAEAHSITQQARLATTLSWVAGYTNILTLLACGQVTSHVTGTASQVGLDVVAGQWRAGAYALSLLVCFVLGAALAGVLMEGGRRRRWHSIYVLPMAVEAILLAAFALLMEWHVDGTAVGMGAKLWLTLIPSAAMGLQNATITRISSGVVRTTHVTGVLTDIGLEGALWTMRRLGRAAPASAASTVTLQRLGLLSGIVAGFILGAALGALAFEHMTRWAMIPAVAFLLWIIVQDLLSPIAEIHSHADVGGELHGLIPDEVAIFHLRPRVGRTGRRARFPDLQAWAEHLPDNVRAVVLDIDPGHDLDADEATAIRVLARRLAHQRKALIVAGVTPERFRLLQASGALDEIDPHNLCSDLELAGARAISLAHDG